MKIHTRIIVDMQTGEVLLDEFYEYSGPLALCDRSLQSQATQAANTASQTAGNYGAGAAGIQANLVPRLEREAVNPPGYGSFGLGEMETANQETAAGATGSAQEAAKLRSMRTGNAAGLGAIEAGGAGAGARASGSALQSILAKNAELKANQMSEANRGLGGILGEDIRGNIGAEGLVPEDIKAGVAAGNSGWLQNLTKMIAAIRGGGGTNLNLGGSGGGSGGGGASYGDYNWDTENIPGYK